MSSIFRRLFFCISDQSAKNSDLDKKNKPLDSVNANNTTVSESKSLEKHLTDKHFVQNADDNDGINNFKPLDSLNINNATVSETKSLEKHSTDNQCVQNADDNRGINNFEGSYTDAIKPQETLALKKLSLLSEENEIQRNEKNAEYNKVIDIKFGYTHPVEIKNANINNIAKHEPTITLSENNSIKQTDQDTLAKIKEADNIFIEEDDVFKEEDEDVRKLKVLERLVSMKSQHHPDKIIKSSKTRFSDSNFYCTSAAKYPTEEEQMRMARRVANSVQQPANQGSRGYSMYVRCRDRSARWTTGVTPEELAAALSFVHEENKKNSTALQIENSQVREQLQPSNTDSSLHSPAKLLRQQTAPTCSVRPQTFLDLSKNLLRTSDKGSRLFAERQALSQSWIVNDPKSHKQI